MKSIMEIKMNNRGVFEETLAICRHESYVSHTGRIVQLPPTDAVLGASAFYVNPSSVDRVPCVGTTTIDVVNGDCIDVARELVEDGYRPILLNMANRHVPGGGVLNGARAQEETLFRRSNLCVSLYQYSEGYAGLVGVPLNVARYPMNRDTGGIYSGKVMFFRAGVQDGYRLLDDPFTCAVVSVAAINRPELDARGRMVDWAVVATKSKIRSMLRIGLLHGHDAIVLSAWGCGAFRNPPVHMAELFHEVLDEEEFANKYRRVRFAVIEDHNSKSVNYAAFAAEFNTNQTEVWPMNEPVRGEDFPDNLTAEMLAGFQTTPSGSTRPRAGWINGTKYIAKCGSWSEYSSDEHVHNEVVADEILRRAGLQVPPSREYRVDFHDGRGPQVVRLAKFAERARPLEEAWRNGSVALRMKIREQVIATYPVISWIAGIDTFVRDNVLVDVDGTLLFVDNGASFDFRARGKRKGWFWERMDVLDRTNGYLSLWQHPNQGTLREILGSVTDVHLWWQVKQYDFGSLVEQLPINYQRHSFLVYSKVLVETARNL